MPIVWIPAGLGFAVSAMAAAAQPPLAGAATSQSPIVRPSLVAPATVAPQPIGPLPSGNYTLTFKLDPHPGFPLGNIETFAALVTRTGNAVTLQAMGHPYVGTIDVDGALNLSRGTERLNGTATGNSAQGLFGYDLTTPPGHLHPAGGHFTIVPAATP